jgi:hypothetical protein
MHENACMLKRAADIMQEDAARKPLVPKISMQAFA